MSNDYINHISTLRDPYNPTGFQVYRAGANACNLETHIARVLPERVCQVPKTDCDVPYSLLAANLSAIREAWVLARQYGIATLSYDEHSNCFDVDRDYGGGRGQKYGSEVAQGLVNSAINVDASLRGQRVEVIDVGSRGHVKESEYFTSYLATNQRNNCWSFYGLLDPYGQKARPILSCRLQKAIENYYKVQDHLALKIAKSYARMISLEGLDVTDTPLVEAIQEETMKKIAEGGDLLAPSGSSLDYLSVSLSDIDKAITPMQMAVASEAMLPKWLVFDEVVANQHALEEHSVYLTGWYMSTVLPVLEDILCFQGWKGVKIYPPSFRGSEYDSIVNLNQADAQYKLSASHRNRALTTQVELGNTVRLKQIENEGLEELAETEFDLSTEPEGTGLSDSSGLSVGRTL